MKYHYFLLLVSRYRKSRKREKDYLIWILIVRTFIISLKITD
jgi:hypothetical protein